MEINSKFSNNIVISRAGNYAKIGNMETESEIIEFMKDGNLSLPPLSLALISDLTTNKERGPDAILEGQWQGKRYRFVAEIKRYGSDRVVMESANQARYFASAASANPLILVPWLSETQLRTLESIGVSGLDLCGNGVIVIPGELLIFRSGQPNKFPLSRTVKRVYQGTSSLVPRVFLVRATYSSVNDVFEEVTARGGSITLPTVSKALKQLEADLIIEKSRSQIRLLQADKLLDKLAANYEPPDLLDQIRCKIAVDGEKANSLLNKLNKKIDYKIILSGTSSAGRYATLAREPLDIYYCTKNPIEDFEKMGVSVDVHSRFPNCEFRKIDSEVVFFDTRQEKANIYASPVQAYLELVNSDKRGQEIAEQLRKKIVAVVEWELENTEK